MRQSDVKKAIRRMIERRETSSQNNSFIKDELTSLRFALARMQQFSLVMKELRSELSGVSGERILEICKQMDGMRMGVDCPTIGEDIVSLIIMGYPPKYSPNKESALG